MGSALKSVKKHQLFTIKLPVNFHLNEYQNKEYWLFYKVPTILGVVLGKKNLKKIFTVLRGNKDLRLQ